MKRETNAEKIGHMEAELAARDRELTQLKKELKLSEDKVGKYLAEAHEWRVVAQDYKERLRKEERRSQLSLDVAEEAAIAAGAMGRVMMRLGQTLENVEAKLQH